jgi:hypothetical protein
MQTILLSKWLYLIALFLLYVPLSEAQEVFRLPKKGFIKTEYDSVPTIVEKIKKDTIIVKKPSCSCKIKRIFSSKDSIVCKNSVSKAEIFEIKEDSIASKQRSFFTFKHIDNSFWWKKEQDTTFNRTILFTRAVGGEGTSLFSDVVVDNIGRMRIAVATVFTEGISRDSLDRVTRSFALGGGNVILRMHYPLVGFRSSKRNTTLYSLLYFAPRFSANLPERNSTTEWNGNVDLGVEGQFFYGGDRNLISISGRVRGAFVYGSDLLTESLNRSNKGFFYAQTSIFIGVKDALITVNLPIYMSADKNQNFPITLSLGYNF